MSGAKHRMRNKKMRNQPGNVTFTPPAWDSLRDNRHWRNGEDTPLSGRSYEQSPQIGGQSPLPSGSRQQPASWISGPRGWGGGGGGKGYREELPMYINARHFANARAAEVNAMLKAVTKTTGSSHVFGALPKHMRRRAMSHNVNRLPRRLRDGARRMLEKSRRAGQKEKKEQSKGKSRKARRRHGNLLLEFNRRQRKNVWLETHIWHAKRFHMVKKWGYCLGDRPTYKCYRACYRAMSGHCLLQDLSYHSCVELQGREDHLLKALSRLTNKETGPTFAAALCLSGRRQGSTFLYKADQYPTQPLGPVLFLWRPRNEHSDHRQLWIWAHPTLKQDLLPELQSVCQCSEAVSPPTPVALPAPEPEPDPAAAPGAAETPAAKHPSGRKRKRAGKEAETEAGPAKKVLGDGTRSPTTPVTWRSDSTGIVISDLTMELVRYRLIGPLSHLVLTEALTPASECEPASETENACLWWSKHCRDDGSKSLHKRQAEVFQLLKGVYSTAEVPAGSVLGLVVDDPRLTLPNKRDKTRPDILQPQGEDEDLRKSLVTHGVPEQCCQSSLWERSVRDNVTHNKISEQELNRMKSELLVPGSRLQPTPAQSHVPVLLVQQPGKQVGEEMPSWGAGWDLLLPKGWGMAFWVPLVYRGVRVGGLQVALKHSQNKGASHFPHDFPDCPAGARFQQELEAQLCEKYRRRPPAKRPNYIKHGCLAPFRCPWQQLTEEWEMIVRDSGEEDISTRRAESMPSAPPKPQPCEETSIRQQEEVTSQTGNPVPPKRFAVLRNRKVLRELSAWCRPTSSRGQRSRWPAQRSPASAASLSQDHPCSLVWVRLSLLRKGSPVQHSMICVPTPEDFQLLRGDPGCCGPLEPRHADHFKSRVKKGKKGRGASVGAAQEHGSATVGAAQEHGSATASVGAAQEPGSATASVGAAQEPGTATPALTVGLWPDPLPSVTSHCSRVTLGWTTQADFSLSAGCGEALGFISLTGLLHMLPSQPKDLRGLVLLRNPASLQYRFAKINIEV